MLCKKVAERGSAARVRDSRAAFGLRARLKLNGGWQGNAAPGSTLKLSLKVENTGDALWLTGPTELKGSVMLGIKVLDGDGRVVFESHGTPPLPRALAPGEAASLALEIKAPSRAGAYALKLDLVAQHVCWFEQSGSRPLVLPLRVQ